MLRRSFLLAAVTFAVACGSDSPTGPSPSIAGTWTLQTVNGSPLPFIVAQTGQNKVELLSDVFVVSETGSFTQTSTLRTTLDGVVTTNSVADAGSYTVSGTAVALHFNSDGSNGTASWSGNTMTTTDGGVPAVYKR